MPYPVPTNLWIETLRRAVRQDNELPARTKEESETLAALRTAPEELRAHADLAIADFLDRSHEPISRLKSDNVARYLRLNEADRLNLVVGRMTVPGGPWPGHYGLEAILFTASEAAMPESFPVLARRPPLAFGEIVAASEAYSCGHGTVLFPELLATRTKLDRQGFGVVFLERLSNYYLAIVLPMARALGLPVVEENEVATVRQLSFLAHEWGHASTPIPYDESVARRGRREAAVVSEILADLSAVRMLTMSNLMYSREASWAIILDRILRMAWLPRSKRQVDSIAGAILLKQLEVARALRFSAGGLAADHSALAELIEGEYERLLAIDEACSSGDNSLAESYIGEWRSTPGGPVWNLIASTAREALAN